MTDEHPSDRLPDPGPRGDAAAGTDPSEFDIPEMALPDDRALRRAVWRGVLTSGLAAAAWLLSAALVLGLIAVGVTLTRAQRFETFGKDAITAANPDFRSTGGGVSSVFTSTVVQTLEPLGAFGHSSSVDVRATQDLFGRIDADSDRIPESPVRAALAHGRPEKSATRAYLATLPASVGVSGVVEFARPLDRAGFEALWTGSGFPLLASALFTSPYAEGNALVGWPSLRLDAFATWAHQLRASDDADLTVYGLPSASTLRGFADSPSIQAGVLDHASLADVRALLDDPRVRSVNIADVGFDPGSGQFPQS